MNLMFMDHYRQMLIDGQREAVSVKEEVNQKILIMHQSGANNYPFNARTKSAGVHPAATRRVEIHRLFASSSAEQSLYGGTQCFHVEGFVEHG